MAKYIIKDGRLVNKESGEAAESVSGKLKSINTVVTDNGMEKLEFHFKQDAEDAEEDILTVRKYGDAALKILRSLFGIVDIVVGKVISVMLEQREEKSSRIVVLADGETLSPVGQVEPYASEKRLLTVRILNALVMALNCSLPVLVFKAGNGAVYDSVDDVCEKVASLRDSGELGSAVLKKIVFGDVRSFNAYVQAIRDVNTDGSIYVTTDAERIAAIMATAEQAPAVTSDDGDDEIEA